MDQPNEVDPVIQTVEDLPDVFKTSNTREVRGGIRPWRI
jgi:hypothetical protein